MNKKILCVMVMLFLAGAVSAQVVVDSVSVEPSYIEAGNEVDISVKFHESLVKREIYSAPPGGEGKSPSGDSTRVFYIAKIIPKNEITSKYVVLKEGEKKVGQMFKGESWSTPFKIKFAEDAPPTSYSFEFQVYQTDESYKSPSLSRTHSFNLTVRGVVVKFTVVADNQAKAGQKTDFDMEVTNVGGGNARHVSVTLNTSYPLTVLGSSEMYMGDLVDSKPYPVSFELYVDSSATPKAYEVPASISYVDRSGVTQVVSKVIGVKVFGSPKIEVSLDNQEDFMQGSTGKVTVSVANKAFIDAKFLSVQLLDGDDYNVISNSESYIGNLASDDFETEEFEIKVSEGASGKIPLKVRVTYTEENNNVVHDEVSSVSMNVMPDEDYYVKHPKTNGISSLISIVLAVPALIVAYLLLWLMFKVVGIITTFIDKHLFKR